ncbi:tetratricopeptide repeat protein [Acinetobacter wuhouensis]|uniref:Tetratricopeptide repeat protein n=1 Tax=Acinetobacter wuhouensis TaxID=1879050 RepID=A0A4Q7AK46_9GAMM|nr:tetratricopeptide repeat protein [Acinetobacter wuhouensis]RZG49149.1 tetratricopeptide repeat protein [Acinetobacter wuhouensis]
MCKKKQTLLVVVLFFILLSFCIGVYWQGLKGGFIFDDFVNLQELGTYGTINTWEQFRAFVINGFSGPTGRPISLASFLLDDNTWPTQASIFKYNNLMIHLLNGALLFWATLLILRNYNYKEQQAIWIALVASSIWLLHPYFVSTTLYVVQRMAQLATLFTLIGIVGYLKARLLLAYKPFQAYFYMAISIGLCTILATYSKENGALLPLLISVIEFCNPNRQNRPIWQWRALCLWLPSCAVLYLIFREINFADNIWPNRNFNQVERLYSEARIVVEYLFNLFIPQIEGRGLYQDGFMVSKSLLQPITTVYSIIFLSGLVISAFVLKSRYPLFSLAVLFFFTAHLMESTVLGLELYFEHRNYLAALLLFLPVASGLYSLQKYVNVKLIYLIIAVILAILCFFTYERVKLWSDTDRLQVYWAKNTPDSVRAQNSLAAILFAHGQFEESNKSLENAMKRMPDSTLLTLRFLLHKLYLNTATHEDFILTTEKLKLQPHDAQALLTFRTLVEYTTQDSQSHIFLPDSLFLISAIQKNPNYKNDDNVKKLVPYLTAKIKLANNEPNEALSEYLKAVKIYNDIESGLMMVAELGSQHATTQALILLDQVEKKYYQQDPKTLKRSKAEYDFESKRLREILLAQLQKDARP